MKIYDIINESAGVTDYNPKSQGGTRKELLAKYHKSKNPKDAAAARKAGATQKELQGVAEGLGAYDNDKGIKHTRESLVAKLESLPKGDEEFEWHKNRAIYHLKQGNMIRARYYMAKMKRGEQGVAEGGFSGSRAGYRPKADDERYPTTWANDANGKLIRVGDTIYFSSHGSLQPGIVQKIYWDDRWSDYGKPEQYLKLELENGETETKSPSWVVKNPPKDVAEGSKEDFEAWKKTIAPRATQSAVQQAKNVVGQKQAFAKKTTQDHLKKVASQQGVAEGIFDIFKKLPAPGSTVKIAGRPVEITHAGVGSDYIGFAWTDKNGKEHYEETSADKHSNLRSLAKTIASEIEYADEGVAEEYDPSYDPEYRGYQKPEQDPDAWKQDRDNADEKESTSIVYVIDNETDEVVLKFKSTGGYYGDVRHALKHGYDTEGPDYGIKWKRMQNETATAGATSAGNVGVGAVYKNKPAKQAKNKDGTAKNALDMKANLLTGGSIKR